MYTQIKGKNFDTVPLCCGSPVTIQGSTKRLRPGLVKFAPAVAYHFYLAMPGAFTQPGRSLLLGPCNACNVDIAGLVKPHEILHIGDDVAKDYVGARGAGWHALLINRGSRDNAFQVEEDHVCRDFGDVQRKLGLDVAP